MFDSASMEVVIALVFIYLIYSLLGSLLQEIIATNIGLRAYILQVIIRRMLNDRGPKKSAPLNDEFYHSLNAVSNEIKDSNKGLRSRILLFIVRRILNDKSLNKPVLLSDEFYRHPLVKYLVSGAWWSFRKLPAYITKETFSKVMIDLLRGTDLNAGDAYNTKIQQSLNEGAIQWNPDISICPDTLKYLKSLWVDAQGDVQKFRDSLEKWFDEMMDRATDLYKKFTQIILLFVGMLIAVSFNVDTVKIVSKLQHNPKLRSQLNLQAAQYTKDHPQGLQSAGQEKELQDSLYAQALRMVGKGGDVAKMNELLALGYDGGFRKNFDNGMSILGWILTALAISLGAPFWFDLLNKIMKLRSAVDSSKGNDEGPKEQKTVVAVKERVG